MRVVTSRVICEGVRPESQAEELSQIFGDSGLRMNAYNSEISCMDHRIKYSKRTLQKHAQLEKQGEFSDG